MPLPAAVRACLIALLFSPIVIAQEPPADTPPLRRWFEIDFAQLGARYRVIETSAGDVTSNQVQHREQFRARFKFDPRARYAVHAGLFTGSAFTSGWNNTGVGTGEPIANLRLKQLFAAATPVDGVQGQVGGLYVTRGESTEITTYDEDAYIMGERVQVTRPKQLWFDEIAFTNAQLAYVTTPGVEHRWDGFGDPNYRQFLVRKKIGDVGASADFTTVDGARTSRAALAVAFAPVSVRLEGYRRVRVAPAGGFAITLERPLTEWLRASGGYATIDRNYGSLNGDRFERGRRIFATTTITFTRWLNLSLFATRAVAIDFPLPIRTRFDAVLTYNLLDSLRRTGVF
jgi:hypothetical protein